MGVAVGGVRASARPVRAARTLTACLTILCSPFTITIEPRGLGTCPSGGPEIVREGREYAALTGAVFNSSATRPPFISPI